MRRVNPSRLAARISPQASRKAPYAVRTQANQNWAGADLNRRHTDFQSVALPTELPARHHRRDRQLAPSGCEPTGGPRSPEGQSPGSRSPALNLDRRLTTVKKPSGRINVAADRERRLVGVPAPARTDFNARTGLRAALPLEGAHVEVGGPRCACRRAVQVQLARHAIALNPKAVA